MELGNQIYDDFDDIFTFEEVHDFKDMRFQSKLG